MNDTLLKAKLPHLINYPSYLPHIGENYGTADKKVFIILESHYLDKKYNDKFTAEDWYNNPKLVKSIIQDGDFEMSSTKANIRHFQKRLEVANFEGKFPVYRKLENSFSAVTGRKGLFKEVVFFNYYQRPSHMKGKSISVNKLDRDIAFNNLLVLNELLEPHRIIFASSKAYNDFKKTRKALNINNFPPASYVPHPSGRGNCWTEPAISYGKNQDGTYKTGEQKFKDILKSIYK